MDEGLSTVGLKGHQLFDQKNNCRMSIEESQDKYGGISGQLLGVGRPKATTLVNRCPHPMFQHMSQSNPSGYLHFLEI